MRRSTGGKGGRKEGARHGKGRRCARASEGREGRQKEECRMQNEGAAGGHWGRAGRQKAKGSRQSEAAGAGRGQWRRPRRTRGIKVDQTKSDQIQPSPTKKNGPVRVTVRAVGSKVARRNLEFRRARWIRGNAERMNGNAKGLSGRNTCFIYDTDERGSGLGGNLRLNSLILAYLRLMREKCLRPAFDVQRFELWADEPAKKESASVHSTWPVGCGWKLLFRRPLCFNPREHVSAPNENSQ